MRLREKLRRRIVSLDAEEARTLAAVLERVAYSDFRLTTPESDLIARFRVRVNEMIQ